MGIFCSQWDWGILQNCGSREKAGYLEILQGNLRQTAKKLNLGQNWIFQPDNDPWHTTTSVAGCLEKSLVKILEYRRQISDLNHIGNRQTELKKRVRVREPTNLDELDGLSQEEWAMLPPDYCQKQADAYSAHLTEIICIHFVNKNSESNKPHA